MGPTLRLYIIYVCFKKLCYENHVLSITVTWHCLQLHLLSYKYNYMFHDSVIVTYLLVSLINVKGKKVNWSRYRPGVAQRVGRGIALLFHDRGTRRGWVVNSTPRPLFTPGKELVPILQEAGWAPGPFWTGGKSRLHRDSIPNRPARSQSLYRLSYPAHSLINIFFKILMYMSSDDFSGWFRLKGNHVKLLISSYLQNLCFLNFGFGRFGGAATRQPPHPLGCAHGSYRRILGQIWGSCGEMRLGVSEVWCRVVWQIGTDVLDEPLYQRTRHHNPDDLCNLQCSGVP